MDYSSSHRSVIIRPRYANRKVDVETVDSTLKITKSNFDSKFRTCLFYLYT
jgi:hypothetical protein